MAAEIIAVQYDELEAVARGFQQQATSIGELQRRVKRAYDALKSEGWEGLGAEAFAAEMTMRILPALARLREALDEGHRAATEVGQRLRQAEEDGARLFAAAGSAGATAGPAAGAATSGPAQPPAGGHMPGARGDLDPEFLRRLDNVAARMKAEGFETRINSGRRTLDEQVMLLTRGRTFDQFGAAMLQEVESKHISAEEAHKWIHYYDPAGGGHPMQTGFKSPVTWTLKSVHLEGRAADVVDPHKGWDVPPGYWDALQRAAEAEGLRIGPPISDRAHVQMKKV